MRTPARLERDTELDPEVLEPIEPERRESLPMVAIVGRPNVGKSTLFNRLAGQRRALVHEKPGMTRDRRVERVDWDGLEFLCVDTGGYDIEVGDPLIENVVEQARLALDEADVLIVVTAVGEIEHPAEQELIELVRRSRKPVFLAVNKADNPQREIEAQEYYRYGFEQVYPISALHGRGIGDLLDGVREAIAGVEAPGHEHVTGGIAIAIVGRQNVGKSSLVNKLVGETRMIASDLPGTTRDAIDTTLRTESGDVIRLIDTAGIRRRGKVERGIEKLSVLSSLIAMRRAQVAVLVLDAADGLTAQDAHIASYILENGLACIIAVNKWDKIEKDGKTADNFTKMMQREWAFLSFAPIVYISALSGQRVDRIFELAKRVYLNAERRIPTARLNDLAEGWLKQNPPPIRKGRRAKIKYMTQVAVHPPTFAVFVNEPQLVHFSYRRYLINRIREAEDFEGTPVRLVMRSKSKPFEERRRRSREQSNETDHLNP